MRALIPSSLAREIARISSLARELVRRDRVLPLALAVLVPTASVHAAPKKAPKLSLEEVAVMLASNDDEELRSALEAAPLLPAAEVMPMLDDRVRAGLTPTLLDVALDSLQLLNDRAAATLLQDLARHRRPEVRVRALESLTRLKHPASRATLVRALGDFTPEVRSAAAESLGELGDHAGYGALLRYFERGGEGAGKALGRLVEADQLDGLLDKLDQYSVERWQPLFASLFARRDVPDASKLSALEKLTARGGDDTAETLASLSETLAPEASPRVRTALQEAAKKAKTP